MGKRLERFGEVRIIDETNGFGLDFVEKTESRFWSTTCIFLLDTEKLFAYRAVVKVLYLDMTSPRDSCF